MNKIIQCVPNFSEGRNLEVIEKIIEPFQKYKEVKLLDYSADKDHNRLVVTIAGTPDLLEKALYDAVDIAVNKIDMKKHKGQHPRMGAVDVIPFIPVKNVTMDEAVELSKKVAEEISRRHFLPVFLYEQSSVIPGRTNLADIRKGQFEKMTEKMKTPEWKPDYGPDTVHKTAGVTAVGARMPLVAFNVNLNTDNIVIAENIAKKIRHISGGLRYCKCMAVKLENRGIVQVSMNMTNYTKTALYTVFELIRIEARRYGVSIKGSEIVGLVPMDALIESAKYYLMLENFSISQVLEKKIME